MKAPAKQERIMSGVTGLGHFGISVEDMPKMLDFYTRVLGLVVTDGGAAPGGPYRPRRAVAGADGGRSGR